jgi:hypothetical protein
MTAKSGAPPTDRGGRSHLLVHSGPPLRRPGNGGLLNRPPIELVLCISSTLLVLDIYGF